MLLNPMKTGLIYLHCKCLTITLIVYGEILAVEPRIFLIECIKCKKEVQNFRKQKISKQTNKKSEKDTFKYSSHTYQSFHGCQRVRTPNKKSLAQQTRYG